MSFNLENLRNKLNSTFHNHRKIFFLVVFVGIFLEFAFNIFKTVPESLYLTFQSDSNALVIGRIQESITNGITSFGGFLIKPGSNAVYVYTSQFGLQGDIFGVLGKVASQFSLDVNTVCLLLEVIVAACTALAITLVIHWLSDEFEFRGLALLPLPIIILTGFPICLYSHEFIGMARSLYWVPFLFYIPLSIMIFMNKKINKDDSGKYPIIGLLFIFIAILVKCLCGFEYISTIMIAGSVPLFYYAVKNRIKIKQFIVRFIQYFCSCIAGFLGAIGFYLLKLYLYTSDWNQALAKLIDSIAKRSYGLGGDVDPVYVDSVNASVIQVVSKYFISEISLFTLAIFIMALFILVIYLVKQNNHNIVVLSRISTDCEQKLYAGICAIFISFISPISWFIFAKGHSYIHIHINFCLWWLPFIPIASAVLIYFIRCWITWHVSEKSLSKLTFFNWVDISLVLFTIPLAICWCICSYHIRESFYQLYLNGVISTIISIISPHMELISSMFPFLGVAVFSILITIIVGFVIIFLKIHKIKLWIYK